MHYLVQRACSAARYLKILVECIQSSSPIPYLSDESKVLTLRVDECEFILFGMQKNLYVSDVFGSDICTCKPYLTYAIEECIRGAQGGGVGVVVYFRKEGRALGEVTKFVTTIPSLFSPQLTSNQIPRLQPP
jgi:hypothetical protein